MLQYSVTVLLCYYITVLLYYCITALLYYCITVLLYYCITVFTDEMYNFSFGTDGLKYDLQKSALSNELRWTRETLEDALCAEIMA